MNQKKIAVILGAGDGLGASIAKEFAKNQFTIILCRRDKSKLESLIQQIQQLGQSCYGYSVDASKEESVLQMIEDVEQNHGPIEVGIFNVGDSDKMSILETSTEYFRKMWELNTFSGFLFGKFLAQKMVSREKGTIIFTGATASLRGNKNFGVFGSTKGGLRNLVQSMAKELGPRGIHVGHVILDGPIDSQEMRGYMKEDLENNDNDYEGLMLNPDNLAKSYWFLYDQPKNAWTFEMDLRTYMEKW